MSTRQLSRDAPQPRGFGVWDYVSASRLNLWLRCPLAFKLRYLDGIRAPATPALFLGKRVHAGLEVYYRHRQAGVTLSPEDVIAQMAVTWCEAVAEEAIAFESEADEAALRTQSAGLVATYLAQAPRDEPRPLGVELTMETPLVDPATNEDLGITLLGVSDLILDGEDGPVIADFKTASRSAPPLEITHEIQLSSYALLFRDAFGCPEGGLEIRALVKTKAPKIETYGYPARTDAHFTRLFSVIREYLDALDSGRFNFRPGWGCTMCDHAGTHCSAWRG